MASTDTSRELCACGYEEAHAGMDNMCADCYWEADAERKKALRSDSAWRFNRIYSFAVTCMNMDHEKAIAYAKHVIETSVT